jgi:hypothetical protein
MEFKGLEFSLYITKDSPRMGGRLPIELQQRLDLLIDIRQRQYQEFCDAVYEKKE